MNVKFFDLFLEELGATNLNEYASEITFHVENEYMESNFGEYVLSNGVKFNIVDASNNNQGAYLVVKAKIVNSNSVPYNITKYLTQGEVFVYSEQSGYSPSAVMGARGGGRQQELNAYNTAKCIVKASHRVLNYAAGRDFTPEQLIVVKEGDIITRIGQKRRLLSTSRARSHYWTPYAYIMNLSEVHAKVFDVVTSACLSNLSVATPEEGFNYAMVAAWELVETSSYADHAVCFAASDANFVVEYSKAVAFCEALGIDHNFVNCPVTAIVWNKSEDAGVLVVESSGWVSWRNLQIRLGEEHNIYPRTAYSLVSEDDYCIDCDATLVTRRNIHLWEELETYVDMSDYISVDDDEYCQSCRIRHRSQSEYVRDIGGDVFGSEFKYMGNTYPMQPYHTGINSYDYSPSIEFYGEGELNEVPYLGVELEIDDAQSSHGAANVLCSILGDKTYAMSDGSLNQGFELGIMPHTMEAHRKMNYLDAFTAAKDMGYDADNTSTCGIHVHFDRVYFGASLNTQTLKAAFMTVILERNWGDFVKFARRNYSRVQQWANNKRFVGDTYNSDSDDQIRDKFLNKYNYDKYVALNIEHRHTYELRIFKGTLNVETYLATLQLVDNLIRLSKEITSLAKAQQIMFRDIVNYNPTPDLVKYCDKVGVFTP